MDRLRRTRLRGSNPSVAQSFFYSNGQQHASVLKNVRPVRCTGRASISAVPAGPVSLQVMGPVRHLRILCAGHWLSDTENIMRTARHGRGRGDEHGSRLQTRQQVATTATACLRAMLALYEQSAGALSYRMTSSWRTSRRLRLGRRRASSR